MKLSTIVTDYRHRMQISQREFSRRCGLSNSYISFIENEFNPRTGKPIVPTIEQYHKIASGMGMTVQQLFELLDEDSPVDLHVHVPDPDDQPAEQPYTPKTLEARSLAKGMDTMPEARRKAIMEFMISMAPDIFKEGNENDDT